MHNASGSSDSRKFVVESFDNCNSPDASHDRKHYEFDRLDDALACARRIVDKALKRTRNANRSPAEWYRHWLTFGDNVSADGTGFDSHAYARRRIREMTGTSVRTRSVGQRTH